MNIKFPSQNQKGFTLMEILAVLIILGVLAAVAVPRYISLEANARNKAIDSGIRDLNALEILTWSDQKISVSGYISDTKIFGSITYDIGENYTWNAGDPKSTGGTMIFKEESITLSRKVSDAKTPAIWRRAP
jgi:prepilin-type N-terminal cleavage/methylation domain-containing protein